MKSLAVTLSYMIYDAVCSHLNGDVRLDNTVHHLVSIVGIGAGLAYQRCGTEMMACMFITEISSPLLHLREMLKELGIKDTDSTSSSMYTDLNLFFHPPSLLSLVRCELYYN
ncbi:hypothetical protein ZWY2020_031076 [Hordeum vulgare]|nr:hypothetical protein ZWY2020_031076 [Hordeum vulgare]